MLSQLRSLRVREWIKSNQIKQLVTSFIINNVKCFMQQTTERWLIAELWIGWLIGQKKTFKTTSFASEKVSSFSPVQALHLHHPHPSNTAPKLAQSRGICRRHISANKDMPCLEVGASQHTAEASEKIPTLKKVSKENKHSKKPWCYSNF